MNLLDGHNRNHTNFFICVGYLFKGVKLHIPSISFGEFLAFELHFGGLATHFVMDKTIALVEGMFYWPYLKSNVARIVSQCCTCHLGKAKKQIIGLCTPLMIPHTPCVILACTLSLGCSRTTKAYDSILVVTGRFSKMVLFQDH